MSKDRKNCKHLVGPSESGFAKVGHVFTVESGGVDYLEGAWTNGR